MVAILLSYNDSASSSTTVGNGVENDPTSIILGTGGTISIRNFHASFITQLLSSVFI